MSVKLYVKSYCPYCHRAKDLLSSKGIEFEEIVNFLKDNKLNDVKMQLQIHKIIWDKDKRGV